jgi:hypothetical protein
LPSHARLIRLIRRVGVANYAASGLLFSGIEDHAVPSENVAMFGEVGREDGLVGAERAGQVRAEHPGVGLEQAVVAEDIGHNLEHAQVAVFEEAPVVPVAAGEFPDDEVQTFAFQESPGGTGEPGAIERVEERFLLDAFDVEMRGWQAGRGSAGRRS